MNPPYRVTSGLPPRSVLDAELAEAVLVKPFEFRPFVQMLFAR